MAKSTARKVYDKIMGTSKKGDATISGAKTAIKQAKGKRDAAIDKALGRPSRRDGLKDTGAKW